MPSTVKSGPSDCPTRNGWSGARGFAALPESVFSTGRTPVSVTSITLRSVMSAVMTTPSIGRSYGFGCGLSLVPRPS